MTDHPRTLTDRARSAVHRLLNPLGRALWRLGIHPDAITVLGLIIVAVGSFFIAQGEFLVAGLLLLLGLPCDALDGAVSRAMQRRDRFGEMLDSTLDRYADGFIFAALSYHFAVEDHYHLMLLALAALLGSYMVSYTRARADGSGINVSVRVGWFTRLERVVVILIVLFIPALLPLGMWVLALGTNITGMQRLWFVHKALREREKV